MSTLTTEDVLDLVRTRLLTFQPLPLTDPTLAELLGASSSYAGSDGNLFLDQTPSDLDNEDLWMVVRLLDGRTHFVDGGGVLNGVVEVQAYGYGRHRQPEVNKLIDLVVEAWLNWIASGDVLITRRPYGRIVIPNANPQNPGDRDLSSSRILLPFIVAPQYLTQHFTT